ncbi:MAG TPA: hypothetical protein VHR39_19945 [Propionibacteriaceae bacterium]|nr:hypothetical protein [Propionibacteriaceae bacterium]
MTDIDTSQLDAALDLAAVGWHVIPTDHPDLPICAGVGKDHDPAECPVRHVSTVHSARRDQGRLAAQHTYGVRRFPTGPGLPAERSQDPDEGRMAAL